MHIDPTLLLVATLTFFAGGLLKGAMGFGLPILAIPILTIIGSLPLALSIAVPPVVATNLWQVWKYRQHRQLPFLRWFLIIGAAGLMTGAFLLKHIEDAYLEILLGSLVLLYLLIRSRKGGVTLSARQRDMLAPTVGGFAGLVHGTTGLSGMVGTPYFHAAGLARPAFIFSNSLMFTVFSMLHMPALATVGLYQASAIPIGLIVMVPAFVGLWLGGLAGDRLKAATFSKLVGAVLAMAAILPIWNGLRQIMSGA